MRLYPEVIDFFAYERLLRCCAEIPWKITPEPEPQPADLTIKEEQSQQEFRERISMAGKESWKRRRKGKRLLEKRMGRAITWQEYRALEWKLFLKIVGR